MLLTLNPLKYFFLNSLYAAQIVKIIDFFSNELLVQNKYFKFVNIIFKKI